MSVEQCRDVGSLCMREWRLARRCDDNDETQLPPHAVPARSQRTNATALWTGFGSCMGGCFHDLDLVRQHRLPEQSRRPARVPEVRNRLGR